MKFVNSFTVFPELMFPEVYNMLQLQDLTKTSATLDRTGYFLLSLSYEIQECVLCVPNVASHYSFHTVFYLLTFFPTVVNNSSTQTLNILKDKTPSCLRIQLFKWQHMDET